MSDNVKQLNVAAAPGKAEMLDMLAGLQSGVERDEIHGLMITALGSGNGFSNYSAGVQVPGSSRIGILMCHIMDLAAGMKL